MGFNDGQKICTTTGEPVEQVRAEQTEKTGQYRSYVVLCEEERQKGFVRPYRDSYKHVGRLETIIADGRERSDQPHEHTHRVGGCGSVTTMGRALSETYARDPTFYGATFCVSCNAHFPVGEFTWSKDGMQVGS